MNGQYYSRITKAMIFIIDFWLINLAFVITREIGFPYNLSHDQSISFFLIFGLVWIIAGFLNKIYRIDTVSLRDISLNLFSTVLIHFLIIGAILATFHIYNVRAEFFAYWYLLTTTFALTFRAIYKLILKYYQFTGFDRRKVIIIGATHSGTALYHYFIDNEIAGYQFTGFFDNDTEQSQPVKSKIIGSLNISLIKNFCLEHGIGEIYFALPLSLHKELLHELSRFADNNFIYFRIAPDFSEVVHQNGEVFLINSIPVITNRKNPLYISINAGLKRFFDIVFSLAVILLLFPIILPIISIAICLDSPGPVFFKQVRPGKRNKLFDCYKFRTMRVNNTGEVQATKNDPRITRVGRFLRKTSLDELPQFFNVLLGNMSVVGPRPNLVSQLEEYSKTIQNYGVRHFVTPGITGYAQVNGFRGETREIKLMEKRVQYDVKYIENWSLALDLKIIFLTIWNIGKGEKNAY